MVTEGRLRKLQKHAEIAQTDLGWFKKTSWDRGHLGFRCGHCKTAILFDSNLIDGKDREWVFAECEYPPIHIGQSLKNKKVENITGPLDAVIRVQD